MSDALADETNLNTLLGELRGLILRAFYTAFPIRNALRTELSWTHYRTLSRIENALSSHQPATILRKGHNDA